ncbi:hypothetical protein RHGRI_017090 [Rhododendron griersonianum]|uniref:DNA-directed DNA polymerase family B exonuclease domain-containing protein n=1 Tax=Rhododendron griersonianum TaxID=479676 RepID=A0AAV6JWL4_9ERIC|nr:hypothetical protein RHGRI_017090 [Rhododendron griersonianum]
MGRLKQQIRGDLNAEMNPFVKEVTGKQAHGDLNGVQAESRGKLQPDPHFDAINVIVLAFQEDNDSKLNDYVLLRSNTEQDQRVVPLATWLRGRCILASICLMAYHAHQLKQRLLPESDVSDTGMLDNLLPEPLVSDSIQHGDLIIGDEWGWTHASGLHIGGRVVLNIWRLMCSELKLNMYTVETVLRRRVAYIQCKVLARWFSNGPGRARYRCIEYVVDRVKLNLEIMNQLDMENRPMEISMEYIVVKAIPRKKKKSSDCLLDMSQISGPDGKSKPTPVSQIGFSMFWWGSAANIVECRDCNVFASSEEKLFSHFMNIIRSIYPDILIGWDIQGSSFGYLAEWAMHLGISLLNEPLVSDSIQHGDLIIDDEWGRTHINRTSELALVFGIDFFSVLSRGSQYRVESMLMRLARTQNYVAISPGSQQVFVSCLTLMVSNDPFIPVDYENVAAQSSYA